MRSLLHSTAGAAVLLMAGATLALAQDPAKGASLLQEGRKAIGGEDKLGAIKRLEVKGTSRRSTGNANIEGELEIFIELPDKFRRNESISFGGPGGPGIDRVEVINGTDGWENTNGGGGRGLGALFGDGGGRGFGGGRGGNRDGGAAGGQPGDGQRAQPSPETLERLRQNQLQNRRGDFARLLVAFLLTTKSPVTWVGTAQSPDGTADVLEIAIEGGTPMRLLLDAASHMPLMMTWQGTAPRGGGFGRRGGRDGQGRGGNAGAAAEPGRGGDALAAPAPASSDGAQTQGRRGGGGGGFQPATFEMHLSEYKAVGGVKLPHLITRGITGQTSEEIEIKSYKVNSNFKANTFTR